MNKAFFEIRGISKSFPGVKALNDVSMQISKGEIRALVGENGAGKSTLIKILNGNYKMDAGSLWIDGKEVQITNPSIAAKLGVSIIFQELNLLDDLSVAENIFAGRLSPKGKPIKWKEVFSKAKILLERIGYDIDPKTTVGTLSIAGKQMVEIAKALSYDARIILMDEPSATLTQSELKKLFEIIKDLQKQGVAVIYISHRMEEIFEICDSVSVMRDGNMIATKPIGAISQNEIIKMMVGRDMDQAFPKRTHSIGEKVLEVKSLKLKNIGSAVSFDLCRGEVLGIAGLVGSGRTELVRAIFGVDYVDSGEIFVKGKKVNIRSPRDAKKLGLAFITEDRKTEGLTLSYTVKSNIVMANLKKCVSKGLLNKRLENKLADHYIGLIGIKTPSREQKTLYLSGGNQQKIVIAKWLNADSDIIIMDEPTRGIDVGAKFEIYELINNMASEGKSIILISSELPEVLGMSDRVLVMKNNQIAAELSGETIDAVDVIQHAL